MRCSFVLLLLTEASSLWLGAASPARGVSLAAARVGAPQKLIAKRGSVFKIVQLADTHFGEDPGGPWGPSQDLKTRKVIESVLDSEKPDLVVWSGDVVTGEDLRSQADIHLYWSKAVQILRDRDIPWTMVFGNHDVCRESGCMHTLRKQRGEAGFLQQRGRRLNFTGVAGPSPAELKLTLHKAKDVPADLTRAAQEKRRKAKEAEEQALKDGEAREKAAEEKLNEVMGSGIREIYPHALPDYEAPEEKEPKAGVPDYAPMPMGTTEDSEAPSPSAPTQAGPGTPEQVEQAPSGPVKKQPGGPGAPLFPTQPEPAVPPEPLKAVPDHAKNREQLMMFDRQFKHSWTAREGVFISECGGMSNYYLRLYKTQADANDDKPSAILWFVDTGGGSMEEQICKDQVEWFRKTSQALRARYGPLPGVLYMHIPSQDFTHIKAQDSSCFGVEDDFVTPVLQDNDLLSLVASAEIDWVFVGHDHGNDFCCPVRVTSKPGKLPARHDAWNVHLCFGRHSGYGGYSTPGMHERGARVMEIDLDMARMYLQKQAGGQGISSWVRLETGTRSSASPAITQPVNR